jgi:hypothetical protein
VGPEKEAFLIHKEVAVQYSPVFKAAFNSDFVEGQTQTYNLEEAKVEAFSLVVQWLYGKVFRPCLTREEIDSLRGSPNRHSLTAVQQESLKRIVLHSEFLVRVWITADYLLIPRLQNLAVDEVGEIHAKRCSFLLRP